MTKNRYLTEFPVKGAYFFIGCSWEYYEAVAVEVNKATGVWPSLWTAHPARVNDLAGKFPETLVVNAHDLTCAKLASLKSLIPTKLDYEPLSSSWQEKFSAERMMVMENLLHRSDPGGNYTHSELRDITNAYFLIAHNLLKYFKPRLIYFEVPPHTMYDLALYYLAKKCEIRTLMVYDTSIPACSVFMHEFNSNKSFFEMPVELKENEAKKNELIDNALQEVGQDMPFYMGKSLFERPLHNMMSGLLKATLCSVRIEASKLYRLASSAIPAMSERRPNLRIKTDYRKRRGYLQSVRPALAWDIPRHFARNIRLEWHYRKKSEVFRLHSEFGDKKFIFIPLSLQPEMSTMPSAGFMYDQKCIVEMICRSIPTDWTVVVKENPKQFTHLTGVPARDARFYDELGEMGVVFAPLDFPSMRIVERAQAVAVTTGTAGFEAILGYKKPVLTFAHTWYSGIPGATFINSYAECKAAVDQLVSGQWNIDEQQIKNFLATLRSRMVYLWGEGSTIQQQGWDETAISKNIARAINVLLRN